MKLWFLLWALGLRMAWLARKNEKFREQLVGKDLVMQIQTKNAGIVRHFIVREQRVRSVRGSHPQPTMVLSFRDADYAAETMIKGGREPMLFMKGMQAQDIAVIGDSSVLMWFMGIAKFLPPRRQAKK